MGQQGRPDTVPFASATGRWILAATVAAPGMAFLDSTAVTVALSAIGDDLGGGVHPDDRSRAIGAWTGATGLAGISSSASEDPVGFSAGFTDSRRTTAVLTASDRVSTGHEDRRWSRS